MSQSASSRRKGGLGRGLASLIPTAPVDGSSAPAGPSLGAAAADVVIGGGPAPAAPAATPAADIGAVYREIPVTAIKPNPKQPRQVFDEEALAELVHSIREFGVMQPIVVRVVDDGDYQLVMGSGVGAPHKRRVWTPSRQLCGRPRMTTSSVTRCWRTFTAHS